MSRPVVLIAIVTVQGLCTAFFVVELSSSFLGWRSTPLNWRTRELLELGAALGLFLGTVTTAWMVRSAQRRAAHVEDQLRVASGAFIDLIQKRFAEWGLTAAERDVALFAIKGLSLQDIARMRATSEGTVKAQTGAIYRKAEVSGRPQLLSLFIDDLMGEALLPDAATTASTSPPER